MRPQPQKPRRFQAQSWGWRGDQEGVTKSFIKGEAIDSGMKTLRKGIDASNEANRSRSQDTNLLGSGDLYLDILEKALKQAVNRILPSCN